jgi:hypothetical protein
MADYELVHHLHIGHAFAHRIFHERYVFREVCASWSPKHLTGDHMRKFLTICQGLHNEDDDLRGMLPLETRRGSTSMLQEAKARIYN